MIDWYNLAVNSLWITGLALALAALSYASYTAWNERGKFSQHAGRAAVQNTLNAAGVLFCAGLAAASDRSWEKGLWLLLAVLFCVQIVMAVIQKWKKTVG